MTTKYDPRDFTISEPRNLRRCWRCGATAGPFELIDGLVVCLFQRACARQQVTP